MRFILLSLSLTFLVAGCKDASPAAANETESPIPEISVEDAKAAIRRTVRYGSGWLAPLAMSNTSAALSARS